MQLKAFLATGLVPVALVHGLPYVGRSNPVDDFLNNISNDFNSVLDSLNQRLTQAHAMQQMNSILSQAPPGVGAAIVTASNGIPQIQLTSMNGPAITLATGSGAVTTTFAGMTFTIATPSSTTAPVTTSTSTPASSSSGSSSASTSSTSSSSSLISSASSTSASLSSATSTAPASTSTSSSSSASDSSSMSTSTDSSASATASPQNLNVESNDASAPGYNMVVPALSAIAGVLAGGFLVL
ncbi:unnamed protein product [Somion occarium]|uniref:Uncharacterized protein n=1 Tax=Somion occarium TaxID=3059160 RepID=A0ABP1CEK0_9APHY